MGKFYVRSKETIGPEDWQTVLSDPEKHWKSGYSAKSLALCWEEACGFPQEIRNVFCQSGVEVLEGIEFIRGDVEFETPLPGGPKGSQSDILVLARANGQRVVLAVEGKVRESFGATVKRTHENAIKRAPLTSGVPKRITFLKQKLQIEEKNTDHVGYQLLHRAASALIEAERFGAATAVMLIHSFSQCDARIDDYKNFVALFGQTGEVNRVSYAGNKNGIGLYLAWVRGEERFLLE